MADEQQFGRVGRRARREEARALAHQIMRNHVVSERMATKDIVLFCLAAVLTLGTIFIDKTPRALVFVLICMTLLLVHPALHLPWVSKATGKEKIPRSILSLLVAILLVGGFGYSQWPREVNVPKLKAKLDTVATGDFEMYGKISPGALVIASLTNDGTPSIAEEWRLMVTLADGRSAVAMTEYMDPKATMHGTHSEYKDSSFALAQSDALYIKAFDHPIEKGKKVRGLLTFRMPFPSDELKKRGTTFVLMCSDVEGKLVKSGPFVFTGVAQPFQWYPGLTPPSEVH